jgi:hypothetical protein
VQALLDWLLQGWLYIMLWLLKAKVGRYLRAEKAFSNIVLFEQRPRDGGIWNYTSDERDEDLFSVPQTKPSGKNQEPIWKESKQCGHATTSSDAYKNTSTQPVFVSPMYERLETKAPNGTQVHRRLR